MYMYVCVYLEHYLDDASDDGQLEELNSRKHFNSFVEQLLNIAQQTAVHCTTVISHTHTHI